ncbi:MAG: amidohydrolase [Saprospiraceae bacterium]|nr:amidohydrolase [Saprospiraceae bacterium]
MKKSILFFIVVMWTIGLIAQSKTKSTSKSKVTTTAAVDMRSVIDKMADEIDAEVCIQRHWFHQNAELSNREFKTSERIAETLKSMGIETQTGIAKTGVVGLIRGAKPGPTILLRADIDGLPVTERVDLPWKSVNKAVYQGMSVGVMHACGHDTHIAMLLGAAKILNSMKDQLKGNIKLVFQPAEEGAPAGEEGGAGLMIQEGLMNNPAVDVAFGLHVNSLTPVGHINYKPAGIMAAADQLKITIKGVQSHGSTPWKSVDPVVIGSEIVMALQTIISRQVDLTKEAAVVTVATFHAGVRNNIIPEDAELTGTIRTLDTGMQRIIHQKIRLIVANIAESMGAEAETEIIMGYPVTYNDPALTDLMLPSIKRVTGEKNTHLIKAVTGAEDFSKYALKVPGLFLFVGGMPAGNDINLAPSHHTPDFYVDDKGMKTGIRALCNLAIDYADQWKSANGLMSVNPQK